MLKVWLPLDGDLHNQGVLNPSISATTPSYTVGKIGQCYKGTDLTITTNNNFGKIWSLCFWGYVIGNSITSNWTLIARLNDNNSNLRIEVCPSSYSNGIYCYSTHNNSSYAITNGSIASPSGGYYDKWAHFCLTSDGTTITKYMNGIKIGTSNYTGSGYINGTFFFANNDKIYKNDIRIYDHCLSAAEVHEIAMGLVLHYKLNSIKIKTGTNLVTGITAGGHTTKLTDGRIGVQTTGENADTYFTINLSESITNGTKYFLSCDASGISEGAYWGFPLGAQGNSTLPFKIYNGHNEYSFTANDISWGSNRLFMDDNGRADWANKATFWNFELYKAPTLEVEDSSGYGHNGAITGNITTNISTPRYSACNNFPDSACSIGIGNLSTLIPEGIFTFNIWFKKITDEWSSKGYETILGGPSGFELEAKVGGTNSPVLKYYSWGGGTTNYTLDEWHMITMVRTTANTQFYLDGELKVTGSAGSIPSGDYFIGAWKTATQQNYRGYLSDARIYCTPLLDNDIKMLYNVGMKVDNLGGVHTFEFNENQSNLMWRPENARAAGLGIIWAEGLGAYTQSNCQVTCDKNGYRIYRPPNLTVSSNGYTMWGGLRIRNSINSGVHTYNASTDNIFGLIKEHTYIFIITVEGKSSNNFTSLGITNNMGWGGGGLAPNPSNVTYKLIGTNFNGKTECYYKFTISDDIVKTCTSTYSSFISGNQYLSYMDFMFGFGYESTGSLGTDLYISNIRLFDLTNKTSKNIQKSGIIEFTQFIEKEENIAKIRNDEELYATEFIEI